jgi:phosphatidylglycerophosphate synthase
MVAVLVATAAAGQRWEGGTVLGRLVGQLAALGVSDVYVVARPSCDVVPAGPDVSIVRSASTAEDLRAVARIARDSGSGPVLVGHGDVVTHGSALGALLTDPRVASGILASADGVDRPSAWGVRTDRGRVLSAASPYHSVHDPNGSFLGMLKVAEAQRAELSDVAERLAALGPAFGDDVPALLTVGLVRSGVHLSQSFLGKLFWARPASAGELEQAAREIRSYDEDRVRLDSAVKPMDGFFTTFFVSPYSKYVARWAARRGFTPNQVTTVSMAIAIAAAAAFGAGSRAGLVAGAVLLQLAFTADCVDGQLARYTLTFTKFGAWLDSIFDRAKEYLVYAGLAVGSSRLGDPVWLLAGAAVTLQTVRHAFDFSYAASEQQVFQAAPQQPLEDPWDGAGPPSPSPSPPTATAATASPASPSPSLATRTLASWRQLNRLPGLIWVKRMLPFPIGERFAVISITAALFTPRTTFTVVLAWGALAALYGLAGRLLRSLR